MEQRRVAIPLPRFARRNFCVNNGKNGLYGVQGYVRNVDPRVFDTLYVPENGRMELQTDLDLQGHRLLNEGVGGLAFDSGDTTMHDDLKANGYRIVGKNDGGFEVDDNGRVKMHGDLDLNGHRL